MDYLHTPISRLPVANLRLFVCSSPIFSKHHTLFKSHNPLHFLSTWNKTSVKKSESLFTSQCHSQSNPSTRWMDNWGNLQKLRHPKKPRPVFSYQNDTDTSDCEGDDAVRRTSTDAMVGGNNRVEMIMERLKDSGYIGELNDGEEHPRSRTIEKGSVEDILYVEEGILPNTHGGFSEESPFGDENCGNVQFPWKKPKKMEEGSLDWKLDRTCLAELILSKAEMRQLQLLALQTTNVMRIKHAGVTQAAVDSIHEKWKSSEIVRLKIEGPLSNDMRSMHEMLERRTGGLVIWRSGTSVTLYRGHSFGDPSTLLDKDVSKVDEAFCEHLLNASDQPRSSSGLEANDLFEPSEIAIATYSNDENKVRSVRRQEKKLAAESILPDSELRRLRGPAFQPPEKMSVKGRHITQDVVNAIHEKWKIWELVKIKFDGCLNLDLDHMINIVESKTGGLVIWRYGTFMTVYRGANYKLPPPETGGSAEDKSTLEEFSLSAPEGGADIQSSLNANYKDELEEILNQLGPRYTDWHGYDPLPVDADMLPDILDYQPPLRILPYGAKASLDRDEATGLRRLSRVIHPHFAIGRSRKLRGLARAMVKLWEKCAMAKVALKRGVSLTTSEIMIQEIRKLTGGILLSRCKNFFTFYRGKNFLAGEVAERLLEWEKLAKSLQDKEEQARIAASPVAVSDCEMMPKLGAAGTLEDTRDADARWGKPLDDKHKEKVLKEANEMRVTFLVEGLEKRISSAQLKIKKAEIKLLKVEQFLQQKPLPEKSIESITDEERFMLRKLGLRMRAVLEIGRRGIFDGTVENIHLHWIHRNLVKILARIRSLQNAEELALSLEAESGGVLISLDKIRKGYIILLFRGRNYKRPSEIRPKNLLGRQKAYSHSIQLQRCCTLERYISTLKEKVSILKAQLGKMDNSENQYHDSDPDESYEELGYDSTSDDETCLMGYDKSEANLSTL